MRQHCDILVRIFEKAARQEGYQMEIGKYIEDETNGECEASKCACPRENEESKCRLPSAGILQFLADRTGPTTIKKSLNQLETKIGCILEVLKYAVTITVRWFYLIQRGGET